MFLFLVNKHSVLAVHNESNKVNPPENEVSDTGEKTDDTGKKSGYVLCFGKSDDTVNTADDKTENELKYNSKKPGNVVELIAKRSVCHSFSSFQMLL